MKVQHTLILFFLCLLVGAYIYFFELRKEPVSADDETVYVTKIDPQSIEKCAFSFVDGREYEFIRLADNRFEMRKPVTGRADFDQLTRILASLGSVEARRSIDPEQQQDEQVFGFDKPQATVKLWQKNKQFPETLQFGASNPIKYSVYLRTEADSTIYAVGEFLLSSFDIDVDHYREHTLLPQRDNVVTGLTLSIGPVETGFVLENETWRMTEPGSYRVSHSKMATLISTIREIRISDFIEEQSDEADAALVKPIAEIEIVRQNRETPDNLVFGETTPDKENRYARCSSDPLPVLVDAACIERLIITSESMIDKKLVTKYVYEYEKLRITMENSSFEFSSIDGEWEPIQKRPDLNEEELGTLVKELLSAVTDCEIQTFLFDVPDQPQPEESVAITITLSAGENNDETIIIGQKKQNGTYTVWTDNGLPAGEIPNESARTILEKAEQIAAMLK